MNETIEKARTYATATLGHEGKNPSELAVEINKLFLEGEISSRETVIRIKAKYLDGIRGGK